MYVNCEKSSNHSNITLRMGKIIRAWNGRKTLKNYSNRTKIILKYYKINQMKWNNEKSLKWNENNGKIQTKRKTIKMIKMQEQ